MTLVSAGADGQLCIWSLEDNEKRFLVDHSGPVQCMAMDKIRSQVVSGSFDGVKVWDLKSGEMVKLLCTGNDTVWNVAMDDTHVVACLSRNNETVLEIQTTG